MEAIPEQKDLQGEAIDTATPDSSASPKPAPEPPKFTEDDLRELEEYRSGKHKAFDRVIQEAVQGIREELARYQVPGLGVTLLQLYQQLATGQQLPWAPQKPQVPNPFEELRQRIAALEQALAQAQGSALEQRFLAAIADRDWATEAPLKEFAAKYVISRIEADTQKGAAKDLTEYVKEFDELVGKLAQKRLQRLTPKEKPTERHVPRRPEVPEPERMKKLDDELEAILAEFES